MPSDVRVGGRRATTVVALTTARRAARSGTVWGALFAALVWNDALLFHTDFPTVESRRQFAQTLGANSSLTAVIGPARHLDTVGGYVAWRMFGLMVIVGAIWGLLTATRLLRGEEDAGRWEMLLSGRTTRRHATAQAIAGLATGFVVLWALTAVATLAVGSRSTVDFSASASLFYATAGTASAAMFLAIGSLTSQLMPTRRQANGLAAAVFAVSYLVRMVADSGTGLAWMRWASPLGWPENMRPLTGSQPLALAPVVLLVVAAGGAAVALAGRRDVGAGVLAHSQAAKANTRLLGGPVVLGARLERWVALAWILGLGVLALIFGVVAVSAAEANVGAKGIEQAVSRLGGQQGGAAAWIGYEFLYLAALVAFAAAGQISAIRSEEADGHLDNLLARPVSRGTWLAGRLGFGAALVAVAGLVTALGGWIGMASRQSGITLTDMLQAGLNVAAPALFVLGVGALLYGLVPRLAVPILYAVVLWSFLIEIIGSSITTNHWLLDTAVLSHLGPAPAAGPHWTAIAWLTSLGVIAALTGLAAFNRRDLAAA
jgi:ABC-2 type transport system permease protein